MDVETNEPIVDFDAIKSHVKDYLKNRLEYFKLSAIGYTAKVAPSIAYCITVSVFLLLFWIFLNTAIALCLGKVLGGTAIGFLIVSGFNLLLCLLVVLLRNSLIMKPIGNWIVKVLVKSLEADEDQ